MRAFKGPWCFVKICVLIILFSYINSRLRGFQTNFLFGCLPTRTTVHFFCCCHSRLGPVILDQMILHLLFCQTVSLYIPHWPKVKKKQTKKTFQSYILMYHAPELHSFHDLNIHILDDWVILWLYFVPYISEKGCKVKFPLHFCHRGKFECMEESNDTSPFTLGCLCSNICTWPEAQEQSHSCQTSWWYKSCKIFVQLC